MSCYLDVGKQAAYDVESYWDAGRCRHVLYHCNPPFLAAVVEDAVLTGYFV